MTGEGFYVMRNEKNKPLLLIKNVMNALKMKI